MLIDLALAKRLKPQAGRVDYQCAGPKQLPAYSCRPALENSYTRQEVDEQMKLLNQTRSEARRRYLPLSRRSAAARLQTRDRSSLHLSAPYMVLAIGLTVGFTVFAPSAIQGEVSTGQDLTTVSLEDLMNMQVTSVSKKDQKLSRTAAAVYVITQEQIRRSGATTIPDLLRLVPGVQVAQIDANTWAITCRGFNGQFANKLLVLIDGRTVYDETNSGVYWDSQDTVLEDIDRIEVVRGPGATIWGTNAVNGVINIFTKSSKDTQGGLLTAGGGSTEQGFGTLRYGEKIGQHAAYRVFGKYFNRGGFDDLARRKAGDSWGMNRGGFRTDWDISQRDSITVQGDIYDGPKGQPYGPTPTLTPPFSTSSGRVVKDTDGGNVLARWNHTLRGGSEMRLQAYFDRVTRTDDVDPELVSTVDLDFQHHLAVGRRQDIVWGLGFRHSSDHLSGSFKVSFQPERLSGHRSSAFAQDEINVVENKVWLTLGAKIEDKQFTGPKVQPNVRLLWTPNNQHTVWLAYSRADRVPSRVDENLRVNLTAFPGPGGVVSLVRLLGNSQIGSENLAAYEFGYRLQPNKQLSLDFAGFYNKYANVTTDEHGTAFFEASPAPAHLVIPLQFGNKMFGATYGSEASAEWRVTRFWTLQGGYAWFVPSLKLDPSSTDQISVAYRNNETPRNQFQAGSRLTLRHGIDFDANLYRVGRLAYGNIPTYNRVDARLGWQVMERMELSLVGQNLLDPRHPEFNGFDQNLQPTQAKRGVYGQVTWRF
jgi:iron complex outermembrane recepter protein